MYHLYLENIPEVAELCGLYCDAKPWLWRLFFGWRKTNWHGAYYRLTEKQHKQIMEVARKLFLDKYENL